MRIVHIRAVKDMWTLADVHAMAEAGAMQRSLGEAESEYTPEKAA